MIALHELTITVADRTLLDGITFSLKPGELLAVLGPNGVGKTTLLRTITGLHRAARGSIEIDRAPIHTLTPVERARRVAYVTSDDALTDALTVRDVVAIGRYPHHRWWEWQTTGDDARAIDEALQAVRIAHLGQRLFSTLSSGERQRAWIAMGLAQETPVLLLDEPTSHLDVHVAHEILGLLRHLARQGKTILCVLHDLNDAATYANRIALLGRGTLLACGEPDLVLAGSQIEEAYGQPMERVHLSDGRLRIFAVDNGT